MSRSSTMKRCRSALSKIRSALSLSLSLSLSDLLTCEWVLGNREDLAKDIIAELQPENGEAGIEIAKLFLNQGETVIYTVGRDPQYQKNIIAETAPLIRAPVIVLVNKNTASASEIVASALHYNCRAVLVSERTFGKETEEMIADVLGVEVFRQTIADRPVMYSGSGASPWGQFGLPHQE